MQHKIVEDYLQNVIPKKLTESIKAELRAEIESHIYDKAEFYMEVGYSEEVAFHKAIEAMGETESVNREFTSLYKDSGFKGFILFACMCTVNLLSVSWFGLGYWYFVEPSMHHYPSIIELTVFLVGFIFITVYTVKCSREKLYKQLSWITSAYGLIALTSCVTSGLFYPIFNAGHLLIAYLSNAPAPERDLAVPVNIVVLVAYAIFSFMSLYREKNFRRKPYRLTLKLITVILSVISVGFVTVYGLAYDKYEYLYNDEAAYEEYPEENYLSNIISEQRGVYVLINNGDDVQVTEKKLIENGFVNQNKEYEKFIDDCFMLPYHIRDYLHNKNPEHLNAAGYEIYCYTNGMDDEDDYDDIVSCIVFAYNGDSEVTYKLFIPDINDGGYDWYQNYSHGEKTQKWFNGLKKNDSTEDSLEFIRSTGAYIIEGEKYEVDKTIGTYKIDLRCLYTIESTFADFLLGNAPCHVSYQYDMEIKSENGKLTDFIMDPYEW